MTGYLGLKAKGMDGGGMEGSICGQTAFKNSESLLILSSRKREEAVFFHTSYVILLSGPKHQDAVLLCDNCG